jgi:hypothetical protein
MKSAIALVCMLMPLAQASSADKKTGNEEGPIPESCPVTRATPETRFTPASPSSHFSTGSTMFWYGSDSLYTHLYSDGRWRGITSPTGTRNKSFWFRKDAEWLQEQPYQLKVTYRQLTESGPMFDGPEVTNAILGKEVAMLLMLEFTRGCWEVTASYKNAQVSFVTWVD